MRLLMQYAIVTLVVVGCVSIPDTFDANITVTIEHVYEQASDVKLFVASESSEAPRITTTSGDNIGLVGATDPLEGMKTRYADIQTAKSAGAIGEDSNGYLEFVGTDRTEESKYLRLILAENDDRKVLYEGIAKAESIPVGNVESAYAETWKK